MNFGSKELGIKPLCVCSPCEKIKCLNYLVTPWIYSFYMPLVFKDQIFTKPIHNEVEAFLKVLFEFSCSNNFKIYFLNIVKSLLLKNLVSIFYEKFRLHFANLILIGARRDAELCPSVTNNLQATNFLPT